MVIDMSLHRIVLSLSLSSLLLLFSCDPPPLEYTFSTADFVDVPGSGHPINLKVGNTWVYEDAEGSIIVDKDQVPLGFTAWYMPTEIVRAEVLPYNYWYGVGGNAAHRVSGKATCYFATFLPARTTPICDGYILSDTSILTFYLASNHEEVMIVGSCVKDPSSNSRLFGGYSLPFVGTEQVTTPGYTGPAKVWRGKGNLEGIREQSYYYVADIGMVKYIEHWEDKYGREPDSLQLQSYRIVE